MGECQGYTVIRSVWVGAKFGTCTINDVNGCVDSRMNVHILASTSVPFTLTTVQVPHTERITVSGGQRYSKMYRLKRYRYTIFEKKIE
jgi:hypothetical protein